MSPTLKADLIHGTGTTTPVTGRKKETLNVKARGAQGPPPFLADSDPPQLPLLMTGAQVDATLNISPRSRYGLITAGKLDPIRLGQRMTRFKSEQVLALANSAYVPLRIPGLRGHDALVKDQEAKEPA
jgi:hypothetical protein